MTIWLLALVLLALLVLVGYSQGAIRMGISFVGLLVAALVAVPLGRFVRPIFPPLGVVHPILIWSLAPFVVFVVISILFKAGALAAHKKVDVYYKYKAGDLRLALWQRLNSRLGACLGALNATVYLVLIALVIYPFSYVTVQLANNDADSRLVKILNRLGRDLEATGLTPMLAALDPVPEDFYDAADLLGLLRNNPLAHGLLARYPAFLAMAERPEYQEMGKDLEYSQLFLKNAPISEIIAHPRTKAMLDNPDTLKEIWGIAQPDFRDLRAFLETGKSAKYDPERLVGVWTFNVSAAISALKKSVPTLPVARMKIFRQMLYPLLVKTTIITFPDKKVTVKALGRIAFAPPGQAAAGGAAAAGAAPVMIQAAPPPSAAGRDFTKRYGIRPSAPVAAPVAAAPPAASAPVALGAVPTTETVNLQGEWQNQGGKYKLTFTEGDKTVAWNVVIEGDEMKVTGELVPLAFDRDMP